MALHESTPSGGVGPQAGPTGLPRKAGSEAPRPSGDGLPAAASGLSEGRRTVAEVLASAGLNSPHSYALERHACRPRMIAHRRARSLALGPCMRLQFEDRVTVGHQIQEVLHAGRIDRAEDAQHEIDAYAHLLPDGAGWTATLSIELPDAHERGRRLPHLSRAAHRLYVDVPGQPCVVAAANEDLADRHLTRPSAVHFLRFRLPAPLRAALLAGCGAALGCADDCYAWRREMPSDLLARLRSDLAPVPIPVPARRADAVVAASAFAPGPLPSSISHTASA